MKKLFLMLTALLTISLSACSQKKTDTFPHLVVHLPDNYQHLYRGIRLPGQDRHPLRYLWRQQYQESQRRLESHLSQN